MSNLVVYKVMPEWHYENFPQAFQRKHNTKVGTWGRLDVFSGELKYYLLDENEQVLETVVFGADSDIPLIAPQAWHKVEPLSEDLRCQLSFLCERDEYYAKKYKLRQPHSEVKEAMAFIQSGKALDFGCGSGRNSLYLQQQGFDVVAFDKNATAVAQFQEIIEQEKLPNVDVSVADAHQVSLSDEYDLIVSTVVLMFLNAENIPDIIHNMQSATKTGGYNVIVCAIDSEDYPLSAHELPFSFAFQKGELAAYYAGWEIEKYNEDVGHLHRLDEHGNRIPLRFATLIARKVA